MKCNPLRWLWGLIPLALLSWIALLGEHERIERDLLLPAIDLELVNAVREGRSDALEHFSARMQCVPRFLSVRNQRFGRPFSADERDGVADEDGCPEEDELVADGHTVVDHGRLVREVAVCILGLRHATFRARPAGPPRSCACCAPWNSVPNWLRKAFTLRMTSLLLRVLLANWAVLTT